MAAIANVGLSGLYKGRPSKLTPELADQIIQHLSVGNYVKPSVEACGISYETFRQWIATGERDRAAGKDTPHSDLLGRLAHAQASAEAAVVGELRKAEDWRAQAFLLERRHRERWGKEDTSRAAAVTVQIPEQLAAVLVDVLRVAGATTIQGEVIDSQSVCQPANTANQLGNGSDTRSGSGESGED